MDSYINLSTHLLLVGGIDQVHLLDPKTSAILSTLQVPAAATATNSEILIAANSSSGFILAV
jgi:hypothetical protein